ncbi:hypothetical protein M8J77_004178 [Diaphorina citri]|nr:hypothetical protein M8J77_004178 [Diaphorina citri]
MQDRTFGQAEIIGLVETWITGEIKLTLEEETDYYIFQSGAEKEEGSRGRPSGGLALLIRKYHQVELIGTNSAWILIRITSTSPDTIIGLFYLKPTLKPEKCAEILDDVTDLIKCNHMNSNIILGGDFNARIGPRQVDEVEIFEQTVVSNERESMDLVTNRRGKLITESMESQGLYVLNGRTSGDTPGNFTLVNSKGKSAVDQVWTNVTNLQNIIDLVIQNTEWCSGADHFPVELIVDSLKTRNEDQEIVEEREVEIINWDSEKKQEYKEEIKIEIVKRLENWNDQPPVEEMNGAWKNIIYEVGRKLKLTKTLTQRKRQKKNNWFNRDCAIKKRKLRRTMRKCKRKKYEENTIKELIEDRKAYKLAIANSKKELNLDIKEKIKNTKNRIQLWEVINRFKIRKKNTNKISKENWERFLKDTYLDVDYESLNMTDVRHPVLDSEITVDEILAVLKKVKTKKSPGADGIPYEFYKNLPQEGLQYLHCLFNQIMDEEKVPTNWGEVLVQMIYKKGNAEEPTNYRAIALINTITKIFTSILEKRISTWAENSGILDEGQAGFRKKRGCRDNVFNLYAAISINIRADKSKVYSCFVDYRRCFDSIDHQTLWRKLFTLGLSGKCIRVIRHLYESAKMRVKTDKGQTEMIKMTKGVMTGDSLSPLLFILFISDLSEFIRSKGIQGLPINPEYNLIALLYADDLVLLTDKENELQKMLDALEEYCTVNKLEVNVEKTKVVVFRRKGKLRKEIKFTYQRTPVEIVPSYIYLGVTFTSGLCFVENVKRFITKTMGAIATVNSLWARTRVYNWEANMIVYNAVVKSTLLYGAEIWGLRYLEELEKPQVKYIKSLLYLPRNTPNYEIRKETGLNKISQEVIRRSINWLITIREMNENRLPQILLLRLQEMARINPTATTYNWAAQLRQIFTRLDYLELFESTDPKDIRKQIDPIMKKIQDSNREEDNRRIELSTYSTLYKNLAIQTSPEEDSHYLKLDVPLYKIRTVTQLRTCSEKLLRITIRGDVHLIETENICTLCNLTKEESLEHFLLECPIYRGNREHYLNKYISSHVSFQSQLINLLHINSIEKLNDVYNFAEICLKNRYNIINEYN